MQTAGHSHWSAWHNWIQIESWSFRLHLANILRLKRPEIWFVILERKPISTKRVESIWILNDAGSTRVQVQH